MSEEGSMESLVPAAAAFHRDMTTEKMIMYKSVDIDTRLYRFFF